MFERERKSETLIWISRTPLDFGFPPTALADIGADAWLPSAAGFDGGLELGFGTENSPD